ncbi:MAG: TspO/MBR family protein [Marmoricola sp.]
MSTWRRAATVGTAVAATAGLGSLASTEGVGSGWYAVLDKPAFQPPPVVFPIAWTALYTDLAAAATAALGRLEGPERDRYRRALALNLVLNAGWSWTFFRWHRLGAAVGVAAALTGSSADLVRRTRPVAPTAGAALAAYPAWCGFATVLSAALWTRNRGRAR